MKTKDPVKVLGSFENPLVGSYHNTSTGETCKVLFWVEKEFYWSKEFKQFEPCGTFTVRFIEPRPGWAYQINEIPPLGWNPGFTSPWHKVAVQEMLQDEIPKHREEVEKLDWEYRPCLHRNHIRLDNCYGDLVWKPHCPLRTCSVFFQYPNDRKVFVATLQVPAIMPDWEIKNLAWEKVFDTNPNSLFLSDSWRATQEAGCKTHRQAFDAWWSVEEKKEEEHEKV
jgi:hypothetical protein